MRLGDKLGKREYHVRYGVDNRHSRARDKLDYHVLMDPAHGAALSTRPRHPAIATLVYGGELWGEHGRHGG